MSEPRLLTKTEFIRGLDCVRRAWLDLALDPRVRAADRLAQRPRDVLVGDAQHQRRRPRSEPRRQRALPRRHARGRLRPAPLLVATQLLIEVHDRTECGWGGS